MLSLRDPFQIKARQGNELRLKHGLEHEGQIEMAAEFIREREPECVSLQFVCYGFHPKGFVWGLVPAFQSILGALPVHIMFHELWLGAEIGARWKDRFVGRSQRQGVLRVLKQLNITGIATSNPAYQAVLTQAGFASEIFPLFGSIPIGTQSPCPPADEYLFVMFGTLHPIWPPRPLLDWLSALDRKARIVHVGHMGAGEAVWQKMQQEFAGRIEFERAGALTPAEVGEVFDRTHFGISTTPWEIIGKSASTVAMLEHGLPVLVNRNDVHYQGWKEMGYSPQLIRASASFKERIHEYQRCAPESRLGSVSEAFLRAFSKRK